VLLDLYEGVFGTEGESEIFGPKLGVLVDRLGERFFCEAESKDFFITLPVLEFTHLTKNDKSLIWS
jgi:hypothetical protein